MDVVDNGFFLYFLKNKIPLEGMTKRKPSEMNKASMFVLLWSTLTQLESL